MPAAFVHYLRKHGTVVKLSPNNIDRKGKRIIMNLSLVLQVEAKGRDMKIKRVNVTSQVVDYLKKNIESGNWAVGEKIPSENQMTEDRKSTRLNSSHRSLSRMPSSA